MNRIARRPRTLARLTRSARGAVIALALAVVWAAPAAAAQPTRSGPRPERVRVARRARRARSTSQANRLAGSLRVSTFCDGTVQRVGRAPGART